MIMPLVFNYNYKWKCYPAMIGITDDLGIKVFTGFSDSLNKKILSVLSTDHRGRIRVFWYGKLFLINFQL